MANVLDIIKKRRSIRHYTDQPIAKEDLELFIDIANHAPSAGNVYPWKIAVVQDKLLLRKIQSVSPGMLGKPTAVMALCNDREKIGSRGGWVLGFMDVAHAAQNICLAATELGIGSCCIKSFNPEAVAELLGVGEQYEVDYLLSLGYPSGEPVMLKKRSVEETVILWE
ncbi:MAG TPA: nitroreductase family protein [Spirochaetota bacterium]|nr:nitroreductase family protein [Spirochaetota bacterium]